MQSENKIQLSIIIPFYNVEKYIAECLNSVYNQDIPETDYEVICVNDASPDGSRDIVFEYQKKHPNLVLVEHEVNKKLGAARNTGRTIARGKYIWNVDSDDYIKPNVLKQLIETCNNDELDVLMFNFYKSVNGVEQLNNAYPFTNSDIYTGIEFTNKYCLNHFGEISPVWSQLYRLEFLKSNNITTPEYNYAEDAPFTFKCLFLAKKIKSIDMPCYAYRTSENSIGSSIELNPTAIKLYEKCFISTRELLKISEFIPVNEVRLIQQYKAVYCYTISLIPNYLNKMSAKEFTKFKSICRKNFFDDLKIVFLLSKKNLFTYFIKIIGPFN